MFARIAASVLLTASLVHACKVMDLTRNFDAVVGRGKPALVAFFAQRCGLCEKLEPTYEELAVAYSYTNEVVIAQVDADKSLRTKYEVKSFPTIKWFDKDGTPEDYQGGLNFADLAEFVTKKSGVRSPPATTQLNHANLEETILDPAKDVLVAFTASWGGHCKWMKPGYEKVAKDFEPEDNIVVANFECDYEPNRPLAKKYGIESFPTIKFFPKGTAKEPIDYKGSRTEKEFVEYLNEKCGTYRAVGGGLNDEAGRVAKLDELAQEFFSAVPTSRKSIYDTAVKVAESSQKHGKHYLHIMKNVLNGTPAYIEKETARLENILQKRALSADEMDEIKVKANILSAFAANKVEEAAAAVESETQVVREEL